MPIIEEIDFRVKGLKVMLVVDEDPPGHSHQMRQSLCTGASIRHSNNHVHILERFPEGSIQKADTRLPSPSNQNDPVSNLQSFRYRLKENEKRDSRDLQLTSFQSPVRQKWTQVIRP